MNEITIHALEDTFLLNHEQAEKVYQLITGDLDPEEIPETAYWAHLSGCFNRPSEDELIMHAVDVVLEHFGVEALGSDYVYSNAGDAYANTVILNVKTGEFFINSWGDLAEELES